MNASLQNGRSEPDALEVIDGSVPTCRYGNRRFAKFVERLLARAGHADTSAPIGNDDEIANAILVRMVQSAMFDESRTAQPDRYEIRRLASPYSPLNEIADVRLAIAPPGFRSVAHLRTLPAGSYFDDAKPVGSGDIFAQVTLFAEKDRSPIHLAACLHPNSRGVLISQIVSQNSTTMAVDAVCTPHMGVVLAAHIERCAALLSREHRLNGNFTRREAELFIPFSVAEEGSPGRMLVRTFGLQRPFETRGEHLAGRLAEILEDHVEEWVAAGRDLIAESKPPKLHPRLFRAADGGDLRAPGAAYSQAPRNRLLVWNSLEQFLHEREPRHGPASFPVQRYPLVAGRDLTDDLTPAAEAVPTSRALHIREFGKECRECGQDLRGVLRRRLQQLPEATVAAGLSPQMSLISRGIDGGASSEWWKIPRGSKDDWSAHLMHLPSQARSPSIRFVPPAESPSADECVFLTLKGGGAFSTRPRADFQHAFGVRHPIARRDFADGKGTMGAHEDWGGLHLGDAAFELRYTLAVAALLDDQAPDLAAIFPKPIDVLRYEMLPEWMGGVTRWLDAGQYRARNGADDEFSGEFGALRVFGRSDVRLLALVNRIFRTSDARGISLDGLHERILSGLGHLYWIHGEQLAVPKAEIRPRKGIVDVAAIAEYLGAISDANAAAAARIAQNLHFTLTATVALVHGAGGHLGASRFHDWHGAMRGGAPAIRNVDLAGGLHDLDYQVHIPWARKYSEEIPGATPPKMWGDLLYLRDTAYWIDTLLRGRELPRDASFRELEVGQDRFYRLDISDDLIAETLTQARKIAESKTPNAAELACYAPSGEQENYLAHFRLGRKWIKRKWAEAPEG